MKKSFATLGLAAVLLASCGTPTADPRVGPLLATRAVPVYVSSNGIDVQPVVRVHQNTTEVRWVIVESEKYRFPDNGIEFKQSSAERPLGCTEQGNPNTTYPKCGRLDDGRMYHCVKVERAENKCYAYSVRLVPAPGSAASSVPVLDPWLLNE